MSAPKKIDYERIEPAWRAGVLSPPQIASEYTAQTGVSVSYVSIVKHFKKLGVTRDLTAKVRAKAESMVMEAMVTGKVSVITNATDAKIINDAATMQANIILAHRKDIPIARELVTKMFKELELQTDGIELLRELSEIMRSEAAQDRRNDLYNKVIDLQGRASTLKTLADSLKTLVALEREAFNIDAGKEDPKSNPFAELMAALAGKPMAVPIVQRDPDYDD